MQSIKIEINNNSAVRRLNQQKQVIKYVFTLTKTIKSLLNQNGTTENQ